MSISTAVGLERLSKVVGYKIKKGNFAAQTSTLPMRVGILAEGNTANQGLMTDGVPVEVTSAKEAGDLFGFGSPIHQILRVLKPLNGQGIGGVPIVVYPQLEAGGSTAAVLTVTVTGTVTKAATHTLSINGRTSIDGQSYSYTVVTTDTVTTIAAKIADAVNGVIGSPVTATSALGVVTLTSKWKGLTSNQLYAEVDNFGNGVGVSYVVASSAAGTGTPSIAEALSNWGNAWNTLVINSYDDLTFADLEAFNGTPNDDFASGQYTAIKFKPFVSFFGSTSSDKVVITALTDVSARKTEVTNVLSPAPNSKGFTYEASANMCYLYAVVGQNTPHLDASGMSYPDMPIPTDYKIGDFSIYDNRDFMAKKGASTVDLVNGVYVVMEALTTYRPDGEIVPQWRNVRSLIQDWNMRFAVYVLEQTYVVDHVIANDDDTVEADKVVKPKGFASVLRGLADEMALKGLIVDAKFMKDSIQVGISSSNPDRLETAFSYKRSGFARIVSTTAEAGFNFGS